MRILIIGGTGTISMAITRQLANSEHEIYLLNRGNRNQELPKKIKTIVADLSNEGDVEQKLEGMRFDAVCQFIGFSKEDVERDFRLFYGKTKQYLFISSASAYNKPVRDFRITEATTLANPYWIYSQNKIACEDFLMKMYREKGFPITIVRPSHTYSERSIPLGVHGRKGSWQVAERMLAGKPVLIHGDGTSLWTLTSSEDFAKGFVGLIGNPHALGETFQITSDETVTWNQIYQVIADSLGVELKAYHVSSEFLAAVSEYDLMGSLIGDKANSVVFDNSKLKKAVPDFQATIRVEQGLKKTVDYILAHEELQVKDEEFDTWCDKVIEKMEELKKSF